MEFITDNFKKMRKASRVSVCHVLYISLEPFLLFFLLCAAVCTIT